MIGDRRCCCQAGCWYFPDDFQRPDSTDPGSDWYEEVGDWGVFGYNLVEDYSTLVDGTDSAKIVCTDQQPAYHAGEQYLSVWIYDVQDDDVFYLYPCATSPTSTAGTLEVKFTCTTAPSQWTVECGSETTYYTGVTATPAGYVQIGVCVDGNSGMAKAWVAQSSEQGLWDDSVSPGTGRYSGFGHDNVTHLNTFDTYRVGELRDRNDVECFPCFCHCRDHFLHKELTLTIVDATGRADCMDGKYGTMTWEWNSGADRWACTLSGNNHPAPDGNGSTWDRTFYLYCAEEIITDATGDNFSLVHDPSGSCCGGGGESCVTSTPTAATCTEAALSLTFGPFKWTYLDLACVTCYNPGVNPPASGEYYVVITS